LQLLRYFLGSLCVLALAVGVTATATVTSDPAPPPDPDHGVNNSTHYTLWSGDKDEPASGKEDWSTQSSSTMQALAQRTDIPYDSPPKAVEQWNRGDLNDFPQTTANESIHPPNATLSNGRFVKDAYTEVFAIQPSTRVRESPSNQSLYVAPNGTVLGTIDYRVEHPANDTAGETQVAWRLEEDDIREVRLEVDGVLETTAAGTHTPTLNYSELAEYPGQSHEVTLVAEIAVTVQKETKTCTAHETNGECRNWNVTVEQSMETVTVRDSVDVVEYDLAVSGFKARYPNGDRGLVVYKNLPWQGYSLSDGRVRGVWRFYSARNPKWDTLVTSTESGDSVSASSLNPLQVNAYPSETGATAVPRQTVTLLDTYGLRTSPPALPTDVHLQVVEQPYTASYGLATRSQTTSRNLSNVTAYGLVRGVSVDASNSTFVEIPINESELTLNVVNESEETVTVKAHLSDQQTGDPIETARRDGYIVLDGTRVNTSENGTVVRTLSRPVGGISARYEPGHWWNQPSGYIADGDSVYVRGTGTDISSALYRISILVSMYLFGVFVISRFTGWHFWPPWRGL
jgi:hypothetical protein